jgi:hypothetical protein
LERARRPLITCLTHNWVKFSQLMLMSSFKICTSQIKKHTITIHSGSKPHSTYPTLTTQKRSKISQNFLKPFSQL